MHFSAFFVLLPALFSTTEGLAIRHRLHPRRKSRCAYPPILEGRDFTILTILHVTLFSSRCERKQSHTRHSHSGQRERFELINVVDRRGLPARQRFTLVDHSRECRGRVAHLGYHVSTYP